LESKGRYVLLLNSDTIVLENTISYIIDFMDTNKEAGAIGCKLVLPDGSLDKACHRGFPTPEVSLYYLIGLAKKLPNNPRFNGYHKGYLNMDETHEIDCLVGTFMMVRRDTIDEVGMLDQTYFMYGEDIDWCYRIKDTGWKITIIQMLKLFIIKVRAVGDSQIRLFMNFIGRCFYFMANISLKTTTF
jgi:GT2 family glycosyltransferase